MPTRDVTVEALKVNRLPTRTELEFEMAVPLAWAMLPSASVARYVVLLMGVVLKYPPILVSPVSSSPERLNP